MYPPSFRETPDRGPGQGPESSVAARIAEEDKHRVKDKDCLLPKQSHSTAKDAEIAEKTNNRVKHKTIIRRPFVASGLAPWTYINREVTLPEPVVDLALIRS